MENSSYIFCGDRPLPANLADVVTAGWSSYDVTKRVYKCLNIKNATIEKNFGGTFHIDGHTVIVYRHGQTPFINPRQPQLGRKMMRVYFVVDKKNGDVAYSTLVPTGRIVQHFNGKLGKGR